MERKVTVKLDAGSSLWEALYKENIVIDRPCNGRGTCNLCCVEVEGIGQVKSCQFQTPGTYEVTLPKQIQFEVIAGPADQICEDVALLDLGSTTMALEVYFSDGTCTQKFIQNAGRSFGADVVSRMEAALQNGDIIKNLMNQQVFDALLSLQKEQQPKELWIAGNTIMLHLFRGLDCTGLSKAPFTPVTLEEETEVLRRDDYEIKVHYLPGFSAYVGADIVSGVYGLKMKEMDQTTLLVDLGTNGELALCYKGRLYVASTAAGPAFESNELALEIYASGICRLLAKALDEEAMDEYGTLIDPYFEEGYHNLSQELIRELQMAKAAICAGIKILLKEANLSLEEVDEVYLAGGMGYYLDPKDAIQIGLLPQEFLGRVKAVGNAALTGLRRYVKTRDKEALEALKKDVKVVELANHRDFEETYIEEMNFKSKGSNNEENCLNRN